MFFSALDRCPEIDLTVNHLWRGSWRRPWKTQLGTGYKNRYMELFLGIDWKLLFSALVQKNTFYLIADWGHVASLAIIAARVFRKYPVGIWADTPQENLTRHPVKKWLRSRLLKWLLPRVGVIFGTGKPALEALSSMGAKPDQLVSLPCFVDLETPVQAAEDSSTKLKAREYRRLVLCENEGIVFSMFGTLSTQKKGQDIGIRAFARCKEQNKEIGLLIAGEGPDREDLEKLVVELSLQDSVVFLGWLEPDDTRALFVATDAVLHPARYDPFPLVVLEGMSFAKTVIGSDACGSVQERIIDRQNGVIFESGNIDQLAQKMGELVQNPDLLSKMGDNARRTAEKYPVSLGVQTIQSVAEKLIFHDQ